MNVLETSQFMTFLWSLYPHAPHLNEDDKVLAIAAWHALLAPFTFEDALKGADFAIKASPKFIPTAPEIALKCERREDADAYRCEEFYVIYDELVDEGIKQPLAFDTLMWIQQQKSLTTAEIERRLPTSDETQIEALSQIVSELNVTLSKITRLRDLDSEAQRQASIDYNRRANYTPVENQGCLDCIDVKSLCEL